MSQTSIEVVGAKTHNLKNISLSIPRDKLVVITGLSGSGKSSLAFDTLYAEGQRRYVESLSSYARQFLSMMEKPDVEAIYGLSPAISIEQKSTSHNPRSTVGTVTEIYDYLRLLYARVGTPYCPVHKEPLGAMTISEMVDKVLQLPEEASIMILAPLVSDKKGEHQNLFTELSAQGFVRVRVDKKILLLEEEIKLDKNRKHTIEVVIDRLKIKSEQANRLAEAFETATRLAEGKVKVSFMQDESKEDLMFSTLHSCIHCGYSAPTLEPKLFSFNNPNGACPSCDGLGVRQSFDLEKIIQDEELTLAEGAIIGWDRKHEYYFNLLENLAREANFDLNLAWKDLGTKTQELILNGSGAQKFTFNYKNERGEKVQKSHTFEGVMPNLERRFNSVTTAKQATWREYIEQFISTKECEECSGTRLNIHARNVFVGGLSIADVANKSIDEALEHFQNLKLEGRFADIAQKILVEINSRLSFLIEVGLEYLTLARGAATLSGGEAQRIRLASQIGSSLVGVMYILDEPSIGLHQRDNERLLQTLEKLRDLGNSVLVVEHDEDAIRAADWILDLGPGAGVMGGEIVAQGKLEDILQSKSLTADYLTGRRKIEVPKQRQKFDKSKQISIVNARGNNLKSVRADIGVGLFTCVTGVSGSGKSTLINSTLYPEAVSKLNRAKKTQETNCDGILGLEHLDKIINIDQSPIGRTPRSNPATYTGLFTNIRELFAATPESRARGYKPGRFSFNVKGGRCEACEGDGLIKVEMHFLADIFVTCDACGGKRYKRETLQITYKGKNISEVLDLTIAEAIEFFDAIPAIKRRLEVLMQVGLSYISLGQSATTLSGGEAQRIKLSKELAKRDTGRTLYLLDEPTTGLHFADIDKLLDVLLRLRDKGNTLVVIEHNLDVIKTADWIIDMGPEGGKGGGEIIAQGTPEEVAKNKKSHTGRFLKPFLEKQ